MLVGGGNRVPVLGADAGCCTCGAGDGRCELAARVVRHGAGAGCWQCAW